MKVAFKVVVGGVALVLFLLLVIPVVSIDRFSAAVVRKMQSLADDFSDWLDD